MRSYHDSTERERSRDRGSKDRTFPGRDVSPDIDPYRRPYSGHQFAKKKRVKFNDQEDIRVFKKQDQPIARSLTEEEIFDVRERIEKQVSRLYDFNWDQKKHFDALSQQNSMKQQKQKQKELYQKLMGMKEEIQFYPAHALAIPAYIVQVAKTGSQSIQKQVHSQRIKDVLGCYYTQINQIPNEPIFQVTTACNKNEPKIIKFNPGGINEAEQFATSQDKNQKQLKGILKMPGQAPRTSASKQSQSRQISPRLIWLLKDMQINKARYNKEMTQMLLKPYKQSGQLDYLMKNPTLFDQLLKSQPTGVQPPPSNVPITQPPITTMNPPNYPGTARISPSPSSEYKPQFQFDPNANQMKTQKYKTVPCKYFHSPQGCVKTQNCTFIHDQRYRGQPIPFMMNRQPYQPPANYNPQGYQQPQRQEMGQSYGNYSQNPPPSTGQQYFQQGNRGMYQNPNAQYEQGQYMQQQRAGYPNYSQMGQQQHYPNYNNPQQMNMYYAQNQGGNVPKGPSNQR